MSREKAFRSAGLRCIHVRRLGPAGDAAGRRAGARPETGAPIFPYFTMRNFRIRVHFLHK